MKKQKIELNILVFILMEALFLLFGFKESLLNILLGTILGIILIYVFAKIPQNKITKIILLLITLIFSINIFFSISSFITNNLLKNYSFIFIIISFIIISLLLAKKNYHSYIKSLEIASYFFVIIKLFSFFLVIGNIDFSNFNYQLLDETKLSFHFIYISLFIFILHQLIYYLTMHQVHKKIYILSIINPIIMKLTAILVMGRTLVYLYDYPYMSVLKRIKYLDFIERMEGILSFEYLFCFFFLTSFILLFIKIIAKDLFQKRNWINQFISNH